ncbi:MFS general substrate transporter [Clavulina sp. PMI_390]|nr:MFS general substrate transporter [Clavulina sp. PMI_390]
MSSDDPKPDVSNASVENKLDVAPESSLGLQNSPTSAEAPTLTPSTSNVAEPPYSIFNQRQKWFIVILVTFCSVFSPLAASIYFPAIPSLTKAFHKDTQSINLTVTIYQISQGIGAGIEHPLNDEKLIYLPFIAPSFWGALADVSGRRPIFIACMVIFSVIQFLLAVIPDSAYGALVALRLLSAVGSSPTIALGAGIVGDIAAPVERGKYMGLVFAGIMVGPCIGPVFGALLDARWGWRSIFWFMGVGSASAMVPMIFFLPETLRSLVGNGSIPARGFSRSLWSVIQAGKQERLVSPSVVPDAKKKSGNPLIALTYILEKDVAIILFFNGFQTTTMFAILTSLSNVMQKSYNLSTSETGLTLHVTPFRVRSEKVYMMNLTISLCSLPIGFSMFISNVISGRVLDWEFRRMRAKLAKQKQDDQETSSQNVVTATKKMDPNDLLEFPVEHARMRLLPLYCIVSWSATIAYGWLLETKQPLVAPLIMQFIAGYNIMAILQISQVMLVDLYPARSASVTANNNLIRCLTSAAGTASINPMTNALGIGWSLVIFTAFGAMLSPLMVLEYKRGMKWRQNRAERDRRRELSEAQGSTDSALGRAVAYGAEGTPSTIEKA